MAKTPEHPLGTYFNPLAGNAGDADFVRGSASPAELTRIATEQIESPDPKQIRVVEGMGHIAYSPQQIREIQTLPPEEREAATTDIIDALLNADLIYIEEPLPPKHWD